LEVIVVGAFMVGPEVWWVAIEGDGAVVRDEATKFIVDVRFADNEWQDVSPGPETPEE